MPIGDGVPSLRLSKRRTASRSDMIRLLPSFAALARFAARALPGRAFVRAFFFPTGMFPSSATGWLVHARPGDQVRNLRLLPQRAERRSAGDLPDREPRADRRLQVAQRFVPAAGLLVHDRRAEQDLAVRRGRAQRLRDLLLRPL